MPPQYPFIKLILLRNRAHHCHRRFPRVSLTESTHVNNITLCRVLALLYHDVSHCYYNSFT